MELKFKRFFEADGGGNGGDAGASQGKADGELAPKSKVNFSPEQQAYFDEKWKAEYAKMASAMEKKIGDRLRESEKLKGMSEAERAAEELKQAKEKIAEYEKQQLVDQYKVELTEKGLPSSFAEIIPAGDAEAARKAVDTLSKFKISVEKELNAKISKLEKDLENAKLRGFTPMGVTVQRNESGAKLSTTGGFINKILNKE